MQWQATALVAPQGNHDFHCGAKHLTLWPSFRQDIAEGTMMGGACTSVTSDGRGADPPSLTSPSDHLAVLGRIRGPHDLQGLSRDELTRLADAIRAFLIEKVSVSGGHLGPNLGVVELTIALHRVFESPRDALIFDTGHQAYPHKLLTGRQDGFDHLRASGGLSGYPSRAESEHDWVESSHASAALSYAGGLAKAFELTGSKDRRVVAIVGDGALTGGMCWEAMNNIAAGKSRRVIVVVNDNGRSYAPTIGGLAERLTSLRTRSMQRDRAHAASRPVRPRPAPPRGDRIRRRWDVPPIRYCTRQRKD